MSELSIPIPDTTIQNWNQHRDFKLWKRSKKVYLRAQQRWIGLGVLLDSRGIREGTCWSATRGNFFLRETCWSVFGIVQGKAIARWEGEYWKSCLFKVVVRWELVIRVLKLPLLYNSTLAYLNTSRLKVGVLFGLQICDPRESPT